MTILLVLIPISLLLLLLAVLAFLWAVRKGQFDDLDTPPLDMLRDDEADLPPGDTRDPSENRDSDPP